MGDWMKALYSVTKNTGEDHDGAGVMCHSLEEKCWTAQLETPVLLLLNGFCVIQTCKLLCFSFFMYSRGHILLQLSHLTTGKVKGEIWLVSDVLLPSFHLTWLPSSWQCFKAAWVFSGSFSLAPQALLSTQDGDND